MNRRIHRVLDGELPAAALSATERRELAAYEAAIDAVRAPEATAPDADVTGAVMWRVAHVEPEPARPEALRRLGGVVRWLVTPQHLQLRPAFGAVLLVLTLGGGALLAGLTPAPPEDAPRLLVQFRMGIQGAHEVALVGDFSGWERRYALEQVAPGVWSTAIALEPGIYDYAFVIDGETWTLDPLAPTVPDGFGGANSRVAVLAPERGRI